ncbi:MAG: ferritin family protein [Deltaproteobacteria bacterium]|nr:ferritin family protein [Deltaproteobacteria bacterium]
MAKKQDLDVFDFAIKAEKDGMDFYMKAAKKFSSSNEQLKKLFVALAKEEAAHMKIFMDFKIKAESKGIDQFLKSPEIDAYLEVIVQEGLFPKGETVDKRLEKVETVGQAAAIAMAAEKNAILLYTELAKSSRDKEQKKFFEKIVKEEKLHLVMVSGLRADHDPLYAALRFGRFI